MSQLNPESDYSNFSTAFDFVINQFKKSLRTAIPANIVEYDETTKRATVLPAIKVMLTDGSTHSKAKIQNVPVLQPSAGGFCINFPVKEGDAVLLVFNDRGLNEFKKTFKESDPAPLVVQNPSDAIALLGFGALEITPSTNDGVSLQNESGENYLNIKNDGSVNVKCSSFNVTTGHYNVTAGRVDYNQG